MKLLICFMCQQGDHDKCQIGQQPPKNHFGGWKCNCDCHFTDSKKGMCDHGIHKSEYCPECHTKHKRSVKT